MTSRKVTLLLADEDTLRRDGLVAVLNGIEGFEVIGHASDGEAALREIRRYRPDIAIVDLNLPRLHSIELIRRVRSEALATRIVVLAGTADDEIIRAVVRSGGDGYLLNNSPARHLIDAIYCVQDGGQYFSPQLRRNGPYKSLPESDSPPPAEFEAGIPEMIDRAVTHRFGLTTDKLRDELEESHVRTLETFAANVRMKLVQRVCALEEDMSMQADAMNQLRDYSLRTEDNLSRLISGVDKLAQQLPQRLIATRQENSEPERQQTPRAIQSRPAPGRPARSFKAVSRIGAGIVILILFAFGASKMASRRNVSATTLSTAQPASVAATPRPAAAADTPTKMLAAQQYSERKDYAIAEDIYRQIVAAEPDNIDALKGLASVLYREDKVDESAAILDQIKN